MNIGIERKERKEDRERKEKKRIERFRLFGAVASLTLTIGFQWILIEVWTISIDLIDMKYNVTKYDGLTYSHQKKVAAKHFGRVRIRQTKGKRVFRTLLFSFMDIRNRRWNRSDYNIVLRPNNEHWTLKTSLLFSIALNLNPYTSIIEKIEKQSDVSTYFQVQFWIHFFFFFRSPNIVNKSWITRVKSTWKLVSILEFVSRLKSFFFITIVSLLFCFLLFIASPIACGDCRRRRAVANWSKSKQ